MANLGQENLEKMKEWDSYDLCRPIEIDGKTHIIGVNSHPKKGIVSINHNTKTNSIDNNDFTSVTFDYRFLEDLINSLIAAKNKKWPTNF